MTPFLILILLKSFAGSILHLNSLNLSISTKIIIMLLTMISPSILYKIVGNLTLVLISLDSAFSLRFYNFLSLLFSYRPIPLISCSSNASFLHLDSRINMCKCKRNALLGSLYCFEDGMSDDTETAVIFFFYL